MEHWMAYGKGIEGQGIMFVLVLKQKTREERNVFCSLSGVLPN
jgi:hypothetical protein